MFSKALKKKNKCGKAQWYISGPLFGLVFTVALLYICSIMLSSKLMPTSLMSECSVISIFVGSAIGGIIAAKKGGGGVLTLGALTGVILFTIVLLITILRPEGKVISDETLKAAVCTIGGGTFGGALCLQRSGSKKHKRRTKHSVI